MKRYLLAIVWIIASVELVALAARRSPTKSGGEASRPKKNTRIKVTAAPQPAKVSTTKRGKRSSSKIEPKDQKPFSGGFWLNMDKPIERPSLELASPKVKRLLLKVDPKNPPQALGEEGQPHWLLGTSTAAARGKKMTLVFLPGAYQPTHNIIIHRLASALKKVGATLNVVSVPASGKTAKRLIKTLPEGKVIIAAHSAGGLKMKRLLKSKKLKSKIVGAVALNSVIPPKSHDVPMLYVASKWDFSAEFKRVKLPNVEILPLESDHSLRHRPVRDSPKNAADYSEATWKMNLELARAIKAMAKK